MYRYLPVSQYFYSSPEGIPSSPDQDGAFVVFPSYICQKESMAF